MRSHSAWKVVLVLTFGFLMLVLGYCLGRTSGTTVIYQREDYGTEIQQTDPAEAVETPAEDTSSSDEKIDINTADAALLETLPGIGPVLAQRIVDYRQTYGLFRTVDEIKDVSGIGDATFAEIESFIIVGETE